MDGEERKAHDAAVRLAEVWKIPVRYLITKTWKDRESAPWKLGGPS